MKQFLIYYAYRDIHRLGTSRMSRQQALQKVNQLQQSIQSWSGEDLCTNSSEIVCGTFHRPFIPS